MYTFTFTTREEYLQQKKEWFDWYKIAIAKVRAYKHAKKDVQRGKLSYGEFLRLHSYAYTDLDRLLEARRQSRIEANRQWQVQHQEA